MIVVNCRFLTQPMTGVQRFAEETVQALVALRSDLILVAPQGELRRAEIGGQAVIQIGSAHGHRWEQLELPKYARSVGKGTTILSLMNTGPVSYRKQIVTHHDVTYLRHPETYSRAFRTAYRALSALTLRRAERIVTVSEFSRGEIADAYRIPADKISVVPNAAGSQFAGGARTGSAFFLAVASVLPHKNLPMLIRSFLKFADEKKSDSVLKLVGSRPAFSGLGSEDSLPDDPRVQWLGRVSDEELIDLYASARALVFPSKYEGFGVPPLEAQAAGCPVISSRAASLPEVLGDSALYFDPNDENELAAVIDKIDVDSQLRDQLISKGFDNVARFSWESSARILSQLLDELNPQ